MNAAMKPNPSSLPSSAPMRHSFRQAVGQAQGFTLLELLLVVGVVAMMFVGIAALTQSWLETQIASSSGQHMQRVARVVEEHMRANWETLTPTTNALTDGSASWAALRDTLQEENLLAGGNMRSPLGVNLGIGYVIDGAGDMHRATIYTMNPVIAKRALHAARQAGSVGGVVADFSDPNFAVGAFSQYEVPVANLTPSGLPCAATADTSCVVGVISYTGALIRGPYLYRNAASTDDLRTMHGDLIMNGNNILGVNNLETQDMNVRNEANLGTTTVSGDATLNGPATMAKGLNVTGDMNVVGNANFSNNVTMGGGTLNADTINSSRIQAPHITANSFHTQNMLVQGGELTVEHTMNVQGNVSVDGQLLAGEVNAGSINTNNGEIRAGTMHIANTMSITGNVTIDNGNPIIVDRLVADGCVRIPDNLDPTLPPSYGVCP